MNGWMDNCMTDAQRSDALGTGADSGSELCAPGRQGLHHSIIISIIIFISISPSFFSISLVCSSFVSLLL